MAMHPRVCLSKFIINIKTNNAAASSPMYIDTISALLFLVQSFPKSKLKEKKQSNRFSSQTECLAIIFGLNFLILLHFNGWTNEWKWIKCSNGENKKKKLINKINPQCRQLNYSFQTREIPIRAIEGKSNFIESNFLFSSSSRLSLSPDLLALHTVLFFWRSLSSSVWRSTFFMLARQNVTHLCATKLCLCISVAQIKVYWLHLSLYRFCYLSLFGRCYCIAHPMRVRIS